MKRKIITIIGILLILIGILLLSFPYFQQYLVSKNTENVSNKFQQTSAQRLAENGQKDASFDFESIRSISVSSTLEFMSSSVNYDQMIGQIVIPSLKMNLTVFNGLNNSNLYSGAATMKPGQVMGKGNYALASHYTPYPGVLFTELQNIRVGATVRLTDKTTIFEYKIYDAKTVKATDVELIEDDIAYQHGNSIISLMSCVSLEQGQDKRFFAFGELVDQYPYTKEKMESFK